VCYVAEAEVYHSHNYSLIEDFRRAFDIGVLHKRQSWLLAAYGHAEGIGGKICDFPFDEDVSGQTLSLACRMPAAQYTFKLLGYKLGRNHSRLPSFLRSSLSMNRLWWRHRPEMDVDQ
jgi:rhamnosyltransferase